MRLGYPLAERLQVLRTKLERNTLGTYPLEFFNSVHQLPVIEVPIELLKYRLQNGRTASLQLEDIAKSNLSTDFYRSDTEAEDCQTRQHELLRKLVVDDRNFIAAFQKERKRQLGEILVDSRGFIVNGNRRICCWRDLLDQSPTEYGHFQVVRVAVLPELVNEAEIRKIESRLQLQPDLRDEYRWHARANMYRQLMRDLNLDSKGVAENFDLGKKEIETSLRMLDLGEQYLETRGKPQQWSLLDKKEFGFRRLVTEEQQLESVLDREILINSAFLVIDETREFGERAWALIPKIRTSLAEWKDAVKDKHAPSVALPQGGASENPFVAGARGVVSEDAQVAEFLRSSDGRGRQAVKESLVEFLQDVADRESEISRAMRLIKGLRMGVGDIKSAVTQGLVPEANIEGVAEAVTELKGYLARIEEWLANRAR